MQMSKRLRAAVSVACSLALLCSGAAAGGCPFSAKEETAELSGAHGRSLLQAPAPSPVAGGCSLQVNGVAEQYSQCTSLDAGSQYDLYYNLTTMGEDAVMDFAFSAVSSGWVGLGFPEQGQNMVGSDAVIAKADTTAPSGASAEVYHLGGFQSSAVAPPGQYLNASDIEASDAAGRISASFVVTLTGALAQQALAGQLNVIYAVGPVDATGKLQQHSVNNGAVLDPKASVVSTASSDDDPTDTPHYAHMLAAHGWIAAVGLGFLIPLGISIAKLFKHTSIWPVAFWLHLVSQVLGLIVGIVGVSLGSQLQVDGGLLSAHKGIGIAAIVLVACQAVAAFSWRPPLLSQKRWLFEAYHWYLGRIAACLGIANVWLGLKSQPHSTVHHYEIAYGVVIGVLFLAWLIPALLKWRQDPIFIPNRAHPAGKQAPAVAGTKDAEAEMTSNPAFHAEAATGHRVGTGFKGFATREAL